MNRQRSPIPALRYQWLADLSLRDRKRTRRSGMWPLMWDQTALLVAMSLYFSRYTAPGLLLDQTRQDLRSGMRRQAGARPGLML
jgi:hypothetical protein